MEKKDYSLYDNNGDIYVIKVLPSFANKLDTDANLSFRFLNQIKASGQLPVGRWLEADTTVESFGENEDSSWVPQEEDEDLKSPARKKPLRDSAIEKRPEILKPQALFCDVESATDDCDAQVVCETRDIEEVIPLAGPLLPVINLGNNQKGTEKKPKPKKKAGGAKGSLWSEKAEVHKLLTEVGVRLVQLNATRKHKEIWSAIAAQLSVNGRLYTGPDCCAKKRSLESYFHRLQKGGMEDAKSWPFYKQMDSIIKGVWPPPEEDDDVLCRPHSSVDPRGSVDVDDTEANVALSITDTHEEVAVTPEAEDVVVTPEAEEVAVINEPEESEDVDAEESEETTALLEEYSEMKEQFDNRSETHKAWEQLSKAMANRGHFITAQACERKYKALRQKYREHFDANWNLFTGSATPSWKYFKTMRRLEGEKNITEMPVVSLTCGTQPKMRKATPQESPAPRTTKGRPPTDSRQERIRKLVGAAKAPRNPLPGSRSAFQAKTIELQERKLTTEERRVANDERFVSEFSLLRKTLDAKNVTLQSSLDLLREIRQSREQVAPTPPPPTRDVDM